MRKLALTLFLALLLPAAGHAATQGAKLILQHVPQAEKVGEGRMTYLWWDVYDAALYASNGKITDKGGLALSLSYLRPLKGADIARTSRDEMARLLGGAVDQPTLQAWYKQMLNIFPNVKAGDNITGIRTPKQVTIFLLNGRELGRINDKQFTAGFFDIWLDPRTRAPELRAQLLAE